MADWKDILSDNEEQITQEELLKYLDDDMAEDEKDNIEKKITSPFEADAVQGLLQVQNTENLQKHVKQLNQKLQQLTAKRQRKEKRKIRIFEWIILAILLLLFICVISYVIISLQNKNHFHTSLLYRAKELFPRV